MPKADELEACPTCHRPYKLKRVKICHKCKKYMGRYDKYHIIHGKDNCFFYEHWSCEDTKTYNARPL